MKFRGAGASTQPGREAARDGARAAARIARPAARSAGSSEPAALQLGDWELRVDPDTSNLIAVWLPTGAEHVVAHAPVHE